jgi:hypothetical protein
MKNIKTIIIGFIFLILLIIINHYYHNSNELDNELEHFDFWKSKECVKNQLEYTIDVTQNENSLNNYKLLSNCYKLLAYTKGKWNFKNVSFDIIHKDRKYDDMRHNINVSYNNNTFSWSLKDNNVKMKYNDNKQLIRSKLYLPKSIPTFNCTVSNKKIFSFKSINNPNPIAEITYNNEKNKVKKYTLKIFKESYVKIIDIFFISFIIKNEIDKGYNCYD